MSEQQSATLIVLVYKIASMLVGLAFAYMGFRLFIAGIYEKAGEMKAAWEGKSLVLRQAAPGTFFAVLGAAIVATAVFRGFTVTPTVTGSPPLSTAHQDDALKRLLGSISALTDPAPLPDPPATQTNATTTTK